MSSEQLVVLDVHGVIFTNPLAAFLADHARRHGRESAEVLRAWTTQLRRPFWLGQLPVAELWATLFPGAEPEALSDELERRYAAGPFFDALEHVEEPIWLLSNHRTEWLLPRLERFGLAGRFERIYVSDAIGAVKPDVSAFQSVRRAAGDRPVLYIDDKVVNVTAAATVFERALHLTEALADRELVPAGTAVTAAASDR